MSAQFIAVIVSASVLVVGAVYYFSTALFHWGISSYLRCPIPILGLTYSSTLHVMIPLMLIWLGMGFLEYQWSSLLSTWEIVLFDFVTMFISWVVFFRAFVNFRKERFVRVWVILAWVIPLSLSGLYSDTPDWRGTKSRLDSRTDAYAEQEYIHLNRIEAGREALDAIADERIADYTGNTWPRADITTIPTWGGGLEKHWLAILKWDYEEMAKIYENRQEIAFYKLYVATVSSFFIWLVWLVPMSIIAGKITGLIKLRTSPRAEVLNTGQRKYLLSTGDWTVLADNLDQESPREFIRSKELSLQVFPARHLSIREVLSEVISAFRGRSSSTAPVPSL